jgi:hypothetical protein
MSISMYQASIPVFARALANLRAVLQKGEAFAIEKGFEPEVLVQSRLIADMLPLVRQVQIATDMAKNGSFRLAGMDPRRRIDAGHCGGQDRRQRGTCDHVTDAHR